jgi:hypothetical protein
MKAEDKDSLTLRENMTCGLIHEYKEESLFSNAEIAPETDQYDNNDQINKILLT